jgi:hypothetical protein
MSSWFAKTSLRVSHLASALLAVSASAVFAGEVDRYADAKACLAQVMAAYEGKKYAELHQKIDGRQDSRRIRMHGHRYEVIVTVSPDVEHRPDGIQVDFDVFDGDEPPTMSPEKRTLFLRAGGVLHVSGK